MKSTHKDDATYYHDRLTRADLSARLTRAQVEADGAHTEAAVCRAALRRIAAAVGIDGETVPAHVADAVERYIDPTS
jgi:hypothetical protein